MTETFAKRLLSPCQRLAWAFLLTLGKGVRGAMSEIPSVGVIGVGRLGTALCACLAQAGLPLAAIASRRRERAEELARALAANYGCQVRAVETSDMASYADLIFVATPDGAISLVAGCVAWRKGQIAVHVSGAETLGVLGEAAQAGASRASFHPLNTFPAVPWDKPGLAFAAATLAHSYVALAADQAQAEETLKQLASSICRGYFTVRESDRVLYHAAAVFASNFVTGLVGASLGLWQTIGYGEREALAFMAPLMSSACANILRLGPVQALTGPAARGDVATVAKHLEALAALPAEAGLAELYRALTLALLPLARGAGTLSQASDVKVRQLLIKEHEHARNDEVQNSPCHSN